jgi:addiction module HigA family antidote
MCRDRTFSIAARTLRWTSSAVTKPSRSLIGKTITDARGGARTMTDIRAGRPVHQPTHPGAILREDVLPALGVSVKDAAAKLGVSRQSLHAVLGERTSVTVEMAVRLGKLCGNGPQLWLRMQQAHDLWKAERELAEAIAGIPTLRAA